MKLKLDADGHVVVQDGKPVYVKDDGSEVAFDVVGTADRIKALNGESKGHREAKETAEAKLKEFEGIDPEKARTAMKTVQNLNDKQLVDAGEVEKVRTEAVRAVEEKYKPVLLENEKLKGDLYEEKIGGSFARSKFIAEKVAVPADLIQSTFGKNFEIKDGIIVAKYQSGDPIYSDANPGKPAEFEEALEKLVAQYPHKDQILKGKQQSGSGAPPPGGGGGGGDKGDFGGDQKGRRAAIGGMFPELPDK